MKKVLFLIQDHKMPSSRVRVINLLPELQKAGINPSILKYPKKFSDRITVFKSLKKFDIIFLQKKLLSPFEVKIVRRLSNKFFFDFDDAIYYRHDLSESLESRTRYVKFRSVVRNADLVVAGNRILFNYASQFNKNIIIIPSAVETRNIPMNDHTNPNERVIIGWVGGEINLLHLKLLIPLFQKLAKDYNIQIRILSSGTIDIPSVDVKYIPWRLETQEQEIAFFDIGVMPLPKNKHTEGKCGYKALQYMAAAVPPVVSDVGINRDIVEHGRTGFVVTSIDEFYKAIKDLIENMELRREMGINARRRAEKYFSVPVIGRRLADTLMNGS